MITRKEKREQEKETNYFFEFLKIKKHFFKEFTNRLKSVKDHRAQGYITYPPEIILFTVIMKNMTGLKSMRSMSNGFNKEECIENVRKTIGLETLDELPHYDTINDFLAGLDGSELEEIRTYMIKELLKKRCFEDYRILGKYWGVIIDGTGLHTFHKKHCEHCLRREYKDKETGETTTIYMHHVLEAKLVVGDMVFSIGSEFIENESEEVTKQDCEIKAFYRLAEKMKTTYKRLPICILGDSLYACEPVFSRCDAYKWKYICRFKEGRIKSVASEFNAIKKMEQNKTEDGLFWVNDVPYNKRTVHLMEAKLETEEGKIKQYVFITNLKITKKNVKSLIAAGRSRWKIENQGFNQQKNIRYHLEHANSHEYTAMKNHYLLIQITDILMQLYEKGAHIFKTVKKTAQEKSSNLLEAFRTRKLTDEDYGVLFKATQVRFIT
ncbi:transposase family protein [Mesobacillus subterraneus]|uniref:Transposase n=1 Tax=Mesobacillus subterraneus TaxID=285983 RepID=A0A0D6Z924_9BACI|nr:transposase family protein [Mesobacillus subterraneus]KIY21088.1 transposase [Mesobacillus subterraneus]